MSLTESVEVFLIPEERDDNFISDVLHIQKIGALDGVLQVFTDNGAILGSDLHHEHLRGGTLFNDGACIGTAGR